MGTKFPELFKALTAEFHPSDVKQRKGGWNKQKNDFDWFSYVSARTVANRLDDVLGPENWSDRYYEVCNVLFCELTITLPDGSKIAKADSGGFKTMTENVYDDNKQKTVVTDQENTDKTGPTDAFKRAAVKFGIGRYLYRDGMVQFAAGTEPDEPSASPANGALPPMKRASEIPQPPPREQPREENERLPVHGSQFYGWMKDQERKYEAPFGDKIKPWAKKLNWHWDSRTWTDDQVSTAVKFVQDMIRRFDDQSSGHEPEHQSQEPTPQTNGVVKGPLQISQQDSLGPLKVDIASTVRQLCFQAFQRQPTNEEIMQRIDMIAAEVFSGEIIGNLRECKDGRILIAVRDAAKREHEACRAFGGSAA